MKHLKLFEDFVLEKSTDTYSKGCVMLYFNFPDIKKIHEIISKEDLYEKDDDRTFGLEDEPHITLLYGLENTVTTNEVKSIIDNVSFGPCKLHNASLFENEYDVLKFDVGYVNKGDSFLHKCNTSLSTLPYQNDYPKYHPHMTIAYLKKGLGKKYVDMLNQNEYILSPTHGIFSQPDGTKTKIDINK